MSEEICYLCSIVYLTLLRPLTGGGWSSLARSRSTGWNNEMNMVKRVEKSETIEFHVINYAVMKVIENWLFKAINESTRIWIINFYSFFLLHSQFLHESITSAPATICRWRRADRWESNVRPAGIRVQTSHGHERTTWCPTVSFLLLLLIFCEFDKRVRHDFF